MDILIILALILINGIFAMSELAVVSSKRIRLQNLSDNGSRGARAALQLADHPSRFLSTVQVGITLIGIFNGAFGEASLVARLTPQLASIPMLAEYAREISLGIVVMGITFASIVLGELVPKRIAMQYPETVATMIAAPMQGLSKIVSPFVKVLSVATDAIIRLLGLPKAKDNSVTQEEITGMIREGTDAGVFERTEHDIVTRALRLDDQRLGALMTPRTDVELIDLEDDIEQNLAKIANSPYSRFPVCRGDRSNILGIVHAGDLFEQAIRNNGLAAINIEASVKPALYVPESVSAMDLLETLKKNRAEIALVVDEYGDIEGMVTLSDVMGALVGDVSVIDDEAHEADAIQREDGSWLIDGGVSLDRFRDLFSTDLRFPDESTGAYHTLAGFVLTQLGRIPAVSDHFEWGGHRFEVMDMDRHRIDKLLISKADVPDSPENATSVEPRD